MRWLKYAMKAGSTQSNQIGIKVNSRNWTTSTKKVHPSILQNWKICYILNLWICQTLISDQMHERERTDIQFRADYTEKFNLNFYLVSIRVVLRYIVINEVIHKEFN